MKKILMILLTLILTSHKALCAGPHVVMQKTYTNDDGSYTFLRITDARDSAGIGGLLYNTYDTNGQYITSSNWDFNYIIQNSSGEQIGGYDYYDSRLTYIFDESNNIIGLKNSWNGPIVETYKYTDSGKILVYDSDGNLKSTYNDFIDQFTTERVGLVANGTIDHTLNLISEDGNFYDYDENGNPKRVYYADGTSKAFSKNGDYQAYDKNGNFLGHFKKDGTKRRIYSVDEATAVTQKGPKNRFIIKYR